MEKVSYQQYLLEKKEATKGRGVTIYTIDHDAGARIENFYHKNNAQVFNERFDKRSGMIEFFSGFWGEMKVYDDAETHEWRNSIEEQKRKDKAAAKVIESIINGNYPMSVAGSVEHMKENYHLSQKRIDETVAKMVLTIKYDGRLSCKAIQWAADIVPGFVGWYDDRAINTSIHPAHLNQIAEYLADRKKK